MKGLETVHQKGRKDMERQRSHENRYQRRNPYFSSAPPPHSSSSFSSSPLNRNNKSSHLEQRGTTANDPLKSTSSPCYVPREWTPRGRRVGSSSSTGPEKSKLQEEDHNRDGKGKEDDLSSFPSLVGTCPHMCPDGERAQRERLQDLAVFERLHGNPRKTSPGLAVKKFCRTISTKVVDPSDVRPLAVLEDTLTYLLNMMDSTDHPFEVVHDFIFDRTRSIRQDLSMQNLVDNKVISMYEKMVKFHVISHQKLQRCGKNLNFPSAHHLNMEQLTKALSSLYNLYDANRDPNSLHEKEAEFRSLYVLLHLDCRTQPMAESLSLWFRHITRTILHSKEMCFARSVLRFFQLGYYKQFLCTIANEASYLQYCILEPYICQVRALCLGCINNVGYKLHPYPLAHVSKLLMIKEPDLERLCHACGLEIFTDETGNKLLHTKQTTFCCPKEGFQSYEFSVLEQFER